MGYYIETGKLFDKARDIAKVHGAKFVSRDDAKNSLSDKSLAVVCVKTNHLFDAAGFCYDEGEFEAFNQPTDYRETKWLTMDREKCKKLTGFERE